MSKKIVFIHPLNNYTGSPNVLSLIIKGFVKKGYTVDLITNNSDGFLTDLEGVNYVYTAYKWSSSKLVTFFLLLWSQLQMFFYIFFKYRKINGIFYLNTILPFGAAWACKILKKKTVYHVHENMWLRKPFYGFYRLTYHRCANKSIFVSNYLRSISQSNEAVVIYNALSPEYVARTKELNSDVLKNDILMVSSLRRFKGIYEFIKLSRSLPEYSFKMVVSASQEEVDKFKIIEVDFPSNLSIISIQKDLHPFYSRAKILLSLTHPEKWIETFGLTILEAMAYGIPAIVPNVGGPLELVEDNLNGYTIDPHNVEAVKTKIRILMENDDLYSKFSSASSNKSRRFEYEPMISQIEQFITS